MGIFSRAVRLQKIHGPNRRGFDRAEWERIANDETAEESDRDLARAGLLFDELFTAIRMRKTLAAAHLHPLAAARLALGIGNFRYAALSRMLRRRDSGELVTLSDIQQQQITGDGDQAFSPDEVFSGIGDGLRHLLTECVRHPLSHSTPPVLKVSSEDINLVASELTTAIYYTGANDFWNDCVANSYKIAERPIGVALVPSDRALEIARVASSYRRVARGLEDHMRFYRWWRYQCPRLEKRRLCRSAVVMNVVTFCGVIHKIDVGFQEAAMNSNAAAIGARLELENGPYASLLAAPLVDLQGVSIGELAHTWQFLRSLSHVVLARLRSSASAEEAVQTVAPSVSVRILASALAKAIGTSKERATTLLRVLTFTGDRSQEVWSQPLVSYGNEYVFAVCCLHQAQFTRIVEIWMRQGGALLDQRGGKFEVFCRETLQLMLERSPLKGEVAIAQEAVRFHTVAGNEEEVDIVLTLGKTILLIEAKCILWPDDSLQFAHYRETIEKAAAQIERKVESARRNNEDLLLQLRAQQYSISETPNIVGCILTNSAALVGFPANGVPVVDLDILFTFLSENTFGGRFGTDVRRSRVVCLRYTLTRRTRRSDYSASFSIRP